MREDKLGDLSMELSVKECHLVEAQFDAPVLQIEFQTDIPWGLNGENTYPGRSVP